MRKKIAQLLQNAFLTLKRYPVVLFFSALLSGLLIYLIGDSYETPFFLIKLIIVSGLGISLQFALKMIAQHFQKLGWIEFLGILFLALLFFFLLPKTKEEADFTLFFWLVPLFILSHLLVSFGAFLQKDQDQERGFWEYNKSLFLNFLSSLFFTAVLTGGILLALVAIENLFLIPIKGETYLRITAGLGVFGSTFIFTTFNETGYFYLTKQREFPNILRVFTQYVLIPLLFIYLAILYFYGGKILLTGELPRGWVSYLVLAYAVAGILALLLVYPLLKQETKSWVRMYGQAFFYTLLPLLILLFVAISTRLLNYGFTERRYFLFLIAVWLSATTFYFIVFRRPRIKFIPISLFVFGLWAIVAPYFNVTSVSIRSQERQMKKLLQENDLLTDGKIDVDKTIKSSVIVELNDKQSFLERRGRGDLIHTYLDTSSLEGGNFYSFSYIFNNVVSDDGALNSSQAYNYVTLSAKNQGISFIRGFDYLLEYKEKNRTGMRIKEDSLSFQFPDYVAEDQNFKVFLNEADSIDLLPKIQSVFKDKIRGDSATAGPVTVIDSLFIDTTIGSYSLRILFESIDRRIMKDVDQKEETTFGLEEVRILIKED